MGVATDLALALDPVLLARQIGLEPDPWQAEVLRSTSPRILLNCSRQAGKSTVTSILAVSTILAEPGALVLLCSPGLRQSTLLYDKCMSVYRSLGRPVPATSETASSLALANGSELVSLPGTEATIRGYSAVRLLIIDEAALVLDGYYFATRPMVAVSQGRIIALSTPHGKRGWWHREWTAGEGWERVEIKAWQCPRLSAEFLREELIAQGERAFAQEYLCTFADVEGSVFSYESIQAALSDDVLPLFGADSTVPAAPSALSDEVAPLIFNSTGTRRLYIG